MKSALTSKSKLGDVCVSHLQVAMRGKQIITQLEQVLLDSVGLVPTILLLILHLGEVETAFLHLVVWMTHGVLALCVHCCN